MNPRRRILTTYDRNAAEFSAQYDGVTTPQVLPGFVARLPALRALDLGCGNGRDAQWMAERGFTVDACDGSPAMLDEARATHAHPGVNHYFDRMPELEHTLARGERYDAVLLSAVWMHLPPAERAKTLEQILRVTNPGALIFISLRHGPSPEDRPMFEVSADELKQLAGYHMLDFEHLPANADQLGRSDVWWDNVSLRTPQGSLDALQSLKAQAVQGAFNSTYKPGFVLALANTIHALGDDIFYPNASQAAVPLQGVLASWASIYEKAHALELPQVPRAPLDAPLAPLRDAPGSAARLLWKRNGPMRHLKDPQSGAPLFTETLQDGTPMIAMPRDYLQAMRSHGVLVRSGMGESMRRFLMRSHADRQPDINAFVSSIGR